MVEVRRARRVARIGVTALLAAVLAACGAATSTDAERGPEVDPGLPALGDTAGTEVDVEPFDRLEVSNGAAVALRQGAGADVRRRDGDAVEVAVEEGVLRISLTEGEHLDEGGDAVDATVTVLDLLAITATGAADVTIVNALQGPELTVRADGASRVGGAIERQALALEVDGASRVQLSGRAERADLDIDGASAVYLVDLAVIDMEAVVAGASQVEVRATGSLAVEASDASVLTYWGGPELGSVEASGGATVQPADPGPEQ